MTIISNQNLKVLTALRHELHSHPEVSGEEEHTAARISSFLKGCQPDCIRVGLGGHGVLAVFRGKEPGPTVMFRCELDGLPLEEESELPYRSAKPEKAHLCGHDGHMAMVAGLGLLLRDARPLRGRVVLLFQPAEEEGKGARKVIDDPGFIEFAPDHIYAIHNLPGFEAHRVVVAGKHFAAASAGLKIMLSGKSSHAAGPGKGQNPGAAMSRIILGAADLLKVRNNFRDFVLLTPIHAVLGNLAYGTSPGHARLHFTMRSFLDSDMGILRSEMDWLVKSIARQENLSATMDYEEVFPATRNHPGEARKVKDLAAKLGLRVHNIRKPFRWSEDFGHFLARYPGAMIGLGSGSGHPALHNPDYDFPDELIPTGMAIYKGLYDQLLNQ